MAYSAVSWAYKDTVTSAKLAQMQENIRSHIFDGHASVVDVLTTVTSSANVTVEAELRAELRMPFTAKANRRYLAIFVGRAQTDTAPNAIDTTIRDSGSAAVPTTASTAIGNASGRLETASGAGAATQTVFGLLDGPPAGAHHLSVFGARSSGAGNITWTKGNMPVMFFILLDVGSSTDYQA